MYTKPNALSRNARIIIALSIVVMVLLLGTGTWFLFNSQQHQSGQVKATPTEMPTPTQDPNAPSPLLFGTNLGLFNQNDQVLRSEPTRAALQQLHPRIIRIPVRPELTEAVEIQAAQVVKGLGA